MNNAPAAYALCTPAKLDVGTTTPSLCRRIDAADIWHFFHRYFRKAVLALRRKHGTWLIVFGNKRRHTMTNKKKQKSKNIDFCLFRVFITKFLIFDPCAIFSKIAKNLGRKTPFGDKKSEL
ncbi:hypothetical protein VSQ48_21880 [Candidatus Ventrimonas sp. KK005]